MPCPDTISLALFFHKEYQHKQKILGDFVKDFSTRKGNYHSFYTLYSETKQSIDVCSFMISSNQVYILRIFNLKYTVFEYVKIIP